MMSKIFIRRIVVVCCLFLFCSAGREGYTLINSIDFPEATFFTTDKLGNCYVVTDNQLLQFDPGGKPLATYSQNNIGTLRYVDATNPMKLLLFYPDFARILILDSKLALQSEVDLRLLKIFQPLSACHSREIGYWIYDREDDQLKKIDFNLQIVQQSGSITQTVGYQLQPGEMIEENGLIYINNPETGILVFDRSGVYYKTIKYPGVVSFQVIDKDVLFISNNRFLRFDSRTFVEKEILLPEHDSVRVARIEQDKLFLLTNGSLKFYSF